MQLAAARLRLGKHDLVPEPLEHGHNCARHVWKHGVAETGREERDAHVYRG